MPPSIRPMAGRRTLGYFRSAAAKRGYSGKALKDLIEDFRGLIGRAEANEPGITDKIERALADPGGDEHYGREFNREAVASVLGDKCTWPGPETTPLGGVDVAGDRREDPSHIAERAEELALIEEGFQALSEKDRSLLRAIYREHRTQAEVAKASGVPPQTLSDDHRKAVQRLSSIVRSSRANRSIATTTHEGAQSS